MRIAHISDLHILDLAGVSRSQLLLNKRLTGWVNLKLKRGSIHRREVVEAMMDDLRRADIDHLVVTGDLTNLALEPEFALALRTLERAGFDASRMSVIPGNHDLYTRGAERTGRFMKHLGAYAKCELDLGVTGPSGDFPFVHLRGDVAIVGLSSALARPPLVSSGRFGTPQLAAVGRALAHPEVATRFPVVLSHHPLSNPAGFGATLLRGLYDARGLRRMLSRVPEVLSLHGHLHRRVREDLTADGGRITRVGATSASLIDHRADHMAGYNVYEVDRGGLRSVHACVWQPERGTFARVEIA